jgi:hypothetical protein
MSVGMRVYLCVCVCGGGRHPQVNSQVCNLAIMVEPAADGLAGVV